MAISTGNYSGMNNVRPKGKSKTSGKTVNVSKKKKRK